MNFMEAPLSYLNALTEPFVVHEWMGWLVRPVASGNNRLFRITNADSDYAVKFCVRDDRDRANREFVALRLLQGYASPVVPRPIHLDLQSYGLSVVVTTWVNGTLAEYLQDDDAMWKALVAGHHAINQITAERAQQVGIPQYADSESIRTRVNKILQLGQDIPEVDRSSDLIRVLARLRQINWPEVAFNPCPCHGDTNIRNYLMTPDNGIVMLDWEYARVDDPVAHFATLLTHPIARLVTEARRRQFELFRRAVLSLMSKLSIWRCEMKTKYDFSKAVREKFYQPDTKFSFPITRLILYVRDMPKVAAFYELHFGFVRVDAGDDDLIYLHSPSHGCGLAILQAAKSQKAGQTLVKLVFQVDDVEAFKQKSAKNGLVFGATHAGPGYAFANAKDPAKNLIQVSSRKFNL